LRLLRQKSETVKKNSLCHSRKRSNHIFDLVHFRGSRQVMNTFCLWDFVFQIFKAWCLCFGLCREAGHCAFSPRASRRAPCRTQEATLLLQVPQLQQRRCLHLRNTPMYKEVGPPPSAQQECRAPGLLQQRPRVMRHPLATRPRHGRNLGNNKVKRSRQPRHTARRDVA